MINKKIVIFLLTIVLFTLNLSVYAYTPGATEYSVDLSKIATSSNAVFTDNKIEIKANGSVTLDLFIPFDASETKITYSSSATGRFTATLNGEEKTTYISSLSTNVTVDFTDSYCKMGNASLSLKPSSNIVISKIVFKKADTFYPASISKDITYSDYDSALQTAVVYKKNSVVLKDKGAVRYLDEMNLNTVLKEVDGKIYVPALSLANALDLYIEDYSDKNYVYLRTSDDSKELILKTGDGILYENGITFLPVMDIAEYFDAYIFSKEDYIVLDYYKLRGKNIVENDAIFNLLKAEFSEYSYEEKQGNIYYVSATVSKTGNGSELSPFKTIQEAADIAKAGDKVIISGGVYRETVTPKNSGTVGNHIVFEAKNGENVVVSAFDEISNFKYYDKVKYVAKLPVKLDFGTDMILYNGVAISEGRTPNSHTALNAIAYPETVTSSLWPTKGNIQSNSIFAKSTTDLSSGLENNLRGATFSTFRGEGWNLIFGKVVDSEKGIVSLKDVFDFKRFKESGVYDWGYFTNSIKTVDVPGEWYANSNALYIIPPANTKGSDLTVEAKQRYLTFDLKDKSYITLSGINTIGGSIVSSENSQMNILDGGNHKYISHFTYPRTSDGDAFNSTETYYSGKAGMYIGGTNNVVKNMNINFSAGSGIVLGGRYSRVYGNTISDIAYGGFSYHAGIAIKGNETDEASAGGGHEIMFNTVYNTGRSCIGQDTQNDDSGICYPLIASEIAYNEFSFANILARDTGILYENGVSMGNDIRKTQTHHNVLHDTLVNPGGTTHLAAGLYHDNNTGNEESYRNILYYTNEGRAFSTAVYVQRAEIFPETYSVVKSFDNKELGYLENGFDKENTSNYPDSMVFNYGADGLINPVLSNYNK